MARIVEIEASVLINSSMEETWNITAVDFPRIDRWDGNVRSSASHGEATRGAPISGRVCNRYDGGKTVETIVAFDETNRRFAYEITEGLPGFVLTARNTWIHEEVEPEKTKLTMQLKMSVKGLLGTIMKGPMKFQMKKVLGTAQEELKHYIEAGKPHPRKERKTAKG